MSHNEQFEKFFELFEWSSDPIIATVCNKIVYVNRAVSCFFPFAKIGAPADCIVPEELRHIVENPENNDGVFKRNVIIGDCICSIKITCLENMAIITIGDIIDSQTGAASVSSLNSWLLGECELLKNSLFTITSALSLITGELPPDLYDKLSDYLISINMNNYKSQKILNNISHITKRMSSEYTRSIVDLSEILKAFLRSFHNFFSPELIKVSADLPENELLVHCELSEIRRAVYNIFDFIVDCLPNGGEICFSLSEHENRAVLRFSVNLKEADSEKLATFDGEDDTRARLIKSIALSHNGFSDFSHDTKELSFAIERALPDSEFIRSPGTNYDIGYHDFLTEFSDVLPNEHYRIK